MYAILITVHLKESTGFEGEIKDDDYICMSCYKSHLSILQQNNSSSISWAALEHDKHMETTATNLWRHSPSLCSCRAACCYRAFVPHVAVKVQIQLVEEPPRTKLYFTVPHLQVQLWWVAHSTIFAEKHCTCLWEKGPFFHKRFGVVLHWNGDLLQTQWLRFILCILYSQ